MLGAEEKREGPPSCASPALDPLLRDLSEKKESFRKGVVSLAAELKDARARLALKEESFARESLCRKAVEKKAESMEEEICKLQCSLEEKDKELQASTSTLEQYLRHLDDIRLQFSVTQVNVEASSRSVESAETRCLSLLNELNEKSSLLITQEDRVNVLGGQVDLLTKSLKVSDDSQKQLKDDVLRIEKDILLAVAKAGYKRDYEVRKILEEVSRKDYENINNLLFAKDEEISQLKHEIKFLSAHWKRKSKDLESQLEKHRRADQELKKRVLKLEFCLQEARSQARKLQRMGERRDVALQELRDQLALKESNQDKRMEKQKIWENTIFKFVTSMSMLALVVFARR